MIDTIRTRAERLAAGRACDDSDLLNCSGEEGAKLCPHCSRFADLIEREFVAEADALRGALQMFLDAGSGLTHKWLDAKRNAIALLTALTAPSPETAERGEDKSKGM